MTRSRVASICLVMLLPACQRAASPATTRDSTATARVVDSAPPTTHILDLQDGTEVWFTVGRVGHGPTGAPCLERGIQLRKGPLKMPVPLLYTSALPVVVRGKLVASLSTGCVSGDEYSIDLKTAQPTRIERPGR